MKKILLILIFILFASQCFAAGPYYIDQTNGVDATHTGLSHAEAWKTLAKATSLAAGSDVYLLCGETWTSEKLSVNWTGSSENHVVIGAYYMAGGPGTETHAVNGDGKPIIDGNNRTYPATTTDGLIEVQTSNDYVDVENIVAVNSNGYAVYYNAGCNNATVTSCDVSGSLSIGIAVRDNSVVDSCTTAGDSYQSVTGGGPFQAGIYIKGDNTEAKNCTVSNSYGEGISAAEQSGLSIHDNLVGDTRSVGIYLDACQNSEIYNNLVVSQDNSAFYAEGLSWANHGIRLNIEAAYDEACSGNKIHHNVVINRYGGIAVNNSKNSVSYRVTGNFIYNNVLIDNYRNLYLYNSYDRIEGINTVENNIFYDNHGESSNVTVVSDGLDTWVFDYNCWYPDRSGETEDSIIGANDTLDNPEMAKATWRGTTTLNNLTFTASDLIPNYSTFDGYGAGTDLGDDYDESWAYNTALPPTTVTTADADTYGWSMGTFILDAEPVAPEPDPATFSSAPSADSSTAISMTATTGSDATPPIAYKFTNDNEEHANAGTGGTTRDWTDSDVTHTDDGLQPNQRYGYTIQMRDADVPTSGTASAVSACYTLAAIPTLTLSNPSQTTIDFLLGANGNPAVTPVTQFSIKCTSVGKPHPEWLDHWVDASGNPSETVVWRSKAQWDVTATINQLQGSTVYGFTPTARNEDLVEAAGVEDSETTVAPPSGPQPTISGGKIGNFTP